MLTLDIVRHFVVPFGIKNDLGLQFSGENNATISVSASPPFCFVLLL